ncbi:MAG TPA: hypothetical protein DIV39_03095, partial [Verrucomicrobiales bacterium]|nr:hypothetical protein [Verrucomicrobiales bacterium]
MAFSYSAGAEVGFTWPMRREMELRGHREAKLLFSFGELNRRTLKSNIRHAVEPLWKRAVRAGRNSYLKFFDA